MLPPLADFMPDRVVPEMVRDFVAEERAELSFVQFMKCAHRHADLAAGPDAQCNRRAEIVALREPRRRAQGCLVPEGRQRA